MIRYKIRYVYSYRFLFLKNIISIEYTRAQLPRQQKAAKVIPQAAAYGASRAW